MGGSIFRGYSNSTNISPEYNILADIPAAQLVYSSKWHGSIISAPVDTSGLFQIRGLQYQTILQLEASSIFATALIEVRSSFFTNDTSRLVAIIQNYKVWYNNGGGYPSLWPYNPNISSSVLYDLEAAYLLDCVYATQATTVIQSVSCPIFSLPHLSITVNATGFTVVEGLCGSAQAAHPSCLFEATAFRNGYEVGVQTMGEAFIQAIST